jgi:hypothetical protein
MKTRRFLLRAGPPALLMIIALAGCGDDEDATSSEGEGGGYLETVIGAKKHAEKMVSEANLKQLGATLTMFAVNHEGRFPDSLADAEASLPGVSYVSGQSTDDDPENILVYQDPPPPSGQRLVLLLDGSVKLMSETQFRQQLQRTKSAIGR